MYQPRERRALLERDCDKQADSDNDDLEQNWKERCGEPCVTGRWRADQRVSR